MVRAGVRVIIRVMQPTEFDSVKKFVRCLFPNSIVHMASSDFVLLAERYGKLVGFAHLVEEPGRIVFHGIGVDQSVRGSGIGTMLMEEVLSRLASKEKDIYLKVKAMNPAVDLYARYGFMLKKFDDAHVLVRRSNA